MNLGWGARRDSLEKDIFVEMTVMRILPLILLSLFLALPRVSFANTDEGVASPFSGSQPYLLVHQDSSNNSTRDPGLYLRNGSEWKLLIPGIVLMDPSRGPIFSHLAIGKVDDRLPATAVVDGKIRLFHVLANPDNPASIITIGDKPIAELATGTKRNIPTIENAQQVTIFQSEFTLLKTKPQQLVLISIKNPAPTGIAESDGLTVAIRVKKGEGEKLEIEGEPVIIDHKFHAPMVLQNMVGSNESDGERIVYSDILQQVFLSRILSEDYGDYQNFANQLAFNQEHCRTQNTGFCPVKNLAHWNLETGRPHYEDTISFNGAMGPLAAHQRYPLVSGPPELQIANNRGSGTKFAGRIRLTKDGTPWYSYDVKFGDSPVVFAVEDQLYLGIGKDSAPKTTKLGTLVDNRLPDKLSVLHVPTAERDDKFRVIISQAQKKDKAASNSASGDDYANTTGFYVLSAIEGTDHLAIETRLTLVDQYYDLDELRARFYSDASVRGFDNQTPFQGSSQLYQQARSPSTPFVDLIGSGAAKDLQYIFTNPTVEENVANDLLYKKFVFEGVGKNPTGLYFRNGSSEEKFLEGTLVKSERQKSYDLLSLGTPISSPLVGQVAARVFAIDPTDRGGERAYNLILHMSVEKDGRVSHHTVNLGTQPGPFDRVQGVRLVAGRKQNGSDMYLVVFTGGQVNYAPLKFDVEKGVLEAKKYKQLLPAPMEPDEFIQRLVYDQTGNLYYILTTGISPNSREFEVLNLQTSTRSFPKREHGANSVSFDFNTIMTDLFHSMNEDSELSWKLQPFRKDSEISSESNSAKDLAKSQLFGKFRQLLSEAADIKQPAHRRIIIVPEEIKSLAMEFVRQSYLAKSEMDVSDKSLFHRFNRQLGVYLFDSSKAEPDAIFENFEIAKSRTTERSVVVADINDLIIVDRPVTRGSQSAFLLNIPEPGQDDEGKPTVFNNEVTPHVLYLLATGAPVEYEDFRKLPPSPIATTLLVGTHDELEVLKAQANYEMDAGVDKAFEIIELPPPTMISKTEMLDELMARPNIKGLNFEFDASGISDAPVSSPREAQQKIFEYAVTRAEAIARPRGENSFTSFVQFEKLYGEKMLTDPIVRNSRKIDRSFIERILTLQFNLPLNLADLAPNDPLKILSGEDAVFRMQRAGMLGEFELKAEIIRLSLAQLNHDPARVMPSTWIWAGQPGTGKTKAWQALVKMLGLKLWVKGGARDNQDANAFYLDTVRVKKGRDGAAVDEVIAELNSFIATPKGSRGFIFIDDLHFADDDLGKAIVQWIRSLQQAEKGVARIRGANDQTMTISVQNLTIGIGMNFSDNKNVLSQFEGADVSALVGKIVATGNRFGMDKSFVDRFGGVYNFDKFHESVKEPSLNEALLEAAQKKLARTGQFVVVDPEFVRMAAKAFPNMGARPFLSKSTEAIITQPDQLQMGRSKVFALIPKSAEEIEAAQKDTNSKKTGAWGEESAEVKAWVHDNSHVIELEQGQAAPLMLMRLMIPSFRSPILESLVYAMQTDARLKSDRLSRGFFLAPALFGVYDHLLRAETIPLKDLKLDESRFELKTKSERAEFQKLVDDLSVSSSPFVTEFPVAGGGSSLWRELGLGGQKTFATESRRDILLKYTDKIRHVVERHLLRVLNVQEMKQMDDVEGWLRSLPEKVPFDSEALGKEVNELLMQFMREFHGQDLREALPGSGNKAMEPYVAARFFMMALDKAITRLPWADLGQKMVKALALITQDQVLGQSVGVQNWLFNPESRASLLKPATTNLIREMVEFNSTVRETPEEERSSKKSRFEQSCDDYLSRGTR